MYSWEISELLQSHDNNIDSQTYIDICNTSPQITRIKYDSYTDKFEMWDNDNYWNFHVYIADFR